MADSPQISGAAEAGTGATEGRAEVLGCRSIRALWPSTQVDRQIIALLHENARIPNVDLASGGRRLAVDVPRPRPARSASAGSSSATRPRSLSLALGFMLLSCFVSVRIRPAAPGTSWSRSPTSCARNPEVAQLFFLGGAGGLPHPRARARQRARAAVRPEEPSRPTRPSCSPRRTSSSSTTPRSRPASAPRSGAARRAAPPRAHAPRSAGSGRAGRGPSGASSCSYVHDSRVRGPGASGRNCAVCRNRLPSMWS